MAITFRELKQYISRTVRVSICFRDGQYENYTMVSDISGEQYDDLYVHGINTEQYAGIQDTQLMK